MAAAKPSTSPAEALRQRVNLLLLKLSDRDTEAMAAAELVAVARSIPADLLPTFVSAVSDARSQDRPPLRRTALRLLALIPGAHPLAAVRPLLPRLVDAALRRLRDPDSSVRAALVDAVRAISSAGASSGECVQLFRPIADALLLEQEQCAQLAAALCLAAAIEAAAAARVCSDDISAYAQRLLPRLVKLARSRSFKAKPALLSVIGSAAAAGGAATPALVGILVPVLREALTSEDWAARKAAAEALTSLAAAERALLLGHKGACLASFEARRFDKVKIVRDSMGRMIDAWKAIPDADDAAPAAGESLESSQREGTAERTSQRRSSTSPTTARSSSPATAARKGGPAIRNRASPPSLRRSGDSKNSDQKAVIADPNRTPVKEVIREEFHSDSHDGAEEDGVRTRLETRKMLFQKKIEGKGGKIAGLKLGSRVVPLEGDGSTVSVAGSDDGGKPRDINAGPRDDDLSVIRMQLVQIENQQSSLLDLLQNFIGSSQSGIRSLETRVHGLEMVLDDISRDLAASSGRIANAQQDAIRCCMLNPKFWRRQEGSRSARFSMHESQSHYLSEDGGRASTSSYKPERHRLVPRGQLVNNPLAEASCRATMNNGIALVEAGK